MKRCAWMFVMIGLVMAAEAPKEDTAKKDQERMQGTWKVAAIEGNGKKATAKEIEKFKWIITKDKITWTDERKNEFLYKLDGSKEPKQINLIFPERKTEITEGIYKLDGDDLTVCIGKMARPKDFTAKAGSRNVLFVLKREKK